MQSLDVGETATIDTQWYDATDTPAEPTSITLTITKPDGTTIVKAKADMTGSESGALAGTSDVWTLNVVVDVEGLWRYDVEGTIAAATVKLPSGAFLVAAMSRTGPCEPWTTWADIEGCESSVSGLDPAQREAVIDQASELLWNLSGRVYDGICQTTRSLCFACVTCAPRVCSCEPWNGIDLGKWSPVWAVWDVTVDGADVPANEYELVNRRWLRRLDGHAWPTHFDLFSADLFRASWAYGRRVPQGGRFAARDFAIELAKACADLECALPKRVTTIVRAGVTYTVIDSMNMIREGRTGLPTVDMWIEADRRGRRPKARIFAPGAPSARSRR